MADASSSIFDRAAGVVETAFETATDIDVDIMAGLIDFGYTAPPPETRADDAAPEAMVAEPIQAEAAVIDEPQPSRDAPIREQQAEREEPEPEQNEFAAEMRALAEQMERQREQARDRDDGMER